MNVIKKSDIDTDSLEAASSFHHFKEKSAYKMVMENLDSFDEIYNYLADEKSKNIFLNLIKSKIFLDGSYIEDTYDENEYQYFEKDIIKLTDDEIFIDGGAYVGDTLEIFLKLVNNKYKKYIAFDADNSNLSKLIDFVNKKDIKNIKCYNYALWDKDETLYFNSNKNSSKVFESNDKGEIKIEATSIDKILGKDKATFIKMDIEGAEQRALIGAKETIKKYHPKLAICIYHNFEDYYKIPQIIKNIDSTYKFYVRHYLYKLSHEVILYAI